MKQLYKNLKSKLDNESRFNLIYIISKCPTFFINVLSRNPHSQLFETRHWWDNYPEVDSVKFDSSTAQYIPKYE